MAETHGAPLVSIIMNAHNSEEFLAEALASVVAQSYTNWEVIFWDNASTDDSRSVAATFGDSRIRYFTDEVKVSLYESRMNAVLQAQGELIAFLDCDDVWMPTKLESQVSVFDDLNCALSSTDFLILMEGKKQRSSRREPEVSKTYTEPVSHTIDVLLDYQIGMSTLMVRRDSALKSWPFPAPPYSCLEDLDMVARVIGVGYLLPVNEALTVYRMHASNFSRRTDIQLLEWKEWRSTLGDFPLTKPELAQLQDHIAQRINLLEIRQALLDGDRAGAIRIISKMRFSKTVLIRYGAVLLPTRVIRRLSRY